LPTRLKVSGGEGEEDKERRRGRKTDSFKDLNYLIFFLLLDLLLRQSITKRIEYISTQYN